MQLKHRIILYELSKRIKFKGAKTFLTTKELGNFLEISQQSASRYLKILEYETLIERKISGKGQWIEISKEGVLALKKIYQNLGTFLEKPPSKPTLQGKVMKGMDEGSYYIKAYSEKIEQKVGFKPYPGTLNVKLLAPQYSRKELSSYAPVRIGEFPGVDRIFGNIKLLPAKVLVKGQTENCYIILPQRTHHRQDEIEIIHPEFLREKFNLKDGDEIELKIELI